MVAALDLVPGVAFGGVVAVVEEACDGEAFGHEAFGEHVAGDLVFEAVHALVEIPGGPGIAAFAACGLAAALGPGAHEEATLAGDGVPTPALDGLLRVGAVDTDIGREAVLVERLEGC